MLKGKINSGYLLCYSEYLEPITKKNALSMTTEFLATKKDVIDFLCYRFRDWAEDSEVYENNFTTFEQVNEYLSSIRENCFSYVAVYSIKDGEFVDLTKETDTMLKSITTEVVDHLTEERNKEVELKNIEDEIARLLQEKEELTQRIRMGIGY